MTSAAADLKPHLRPALAGMELHVVPSTTFRNTYRNTYRVRRC